jgi:ATP-binding cassette subfamily A (ABC1) protein 3
VILLTTHFLDEADKLGDRVAIMAHGKLMCSGSPLFLKNQFGVGYTLTIVKLPQPRSDTEKVFEVSDKIKRLIHSFIPESESLSDVGNEQSFRLPFSASNMFVTLFHHLDEKKQELSIQEYGISVTTLEEVFLRVADIDEEEMHEVIQQLPSHHESGEAPVSPISPEPEPNSEKVLISNKETPELVNNDIKEAALREKDLSANKDKYVAIDEKNPFVKHFVALTIKRAIYGKRDIRMIICQLVLPIILVVIGLSVLLLQPNYNQPDLVLSSAKFNPTFSTAQRNFVPFQIDDSTQSCPTCQAMQSRFNGNPENGVYGVAVPIHVESSSDPFQSCAVGAPPLYNMSAYLIDTPKSDLNAMKGSTLYGAVTLAGETNQSQLIYNILLNNSAIHAAGIFVNEVHQSYLQVISSVNTAVITTHNHPLPQTYKQENQSQTANAFVVALFWIIAFCFIPASFVVFVVKERELKAKHQQIISGANIYAYWLSTYLWDTLSYLPTAALLIAILYAYEIEAFTKGPASGAVVGLLLLYGSATAGITYILSFLFESHSTAQIVIMFFNFISGLCLMVISFVLSTLPTTSKKSKIIRYFFRIFPTFCLGDGILQLTLCVNGKDCPVPGDKGFDDATLQGPLSWDVAGANIVFLAVEAVVYISITLAIEYSLTFPSLLAWLYRVKDHGVDPENDLRDEDLDVQEERRRVDEGGADSDIIKIHNLRKVYPLNSKSGGVINPQSLFCPPSANQVKVAVQSLSFGIPQGQCFGFLGINGAGKTTTLSILSGEFPPTTGEAFVDGYSIAMDQNKIRRKIGYCPQFDALLDLLTVREHLELYGRIKGFHGELLEEIVQGKLDQLNLKEFEHKMSSTLSGGNKRKLSVAIATIGEPPIVFLDEPSTGMDPK